MPDRSWALQRKLMRAPNIGFNAEVYRWFKDLDNNSNSSRLALRNSLLIQANESRTSALFKVQYFREFVQQVHNKPDIYSAPHQETDAKRRHKPQINLYFRETYNNKNKGKGLVAGEISFRIMDKESETITQANLQQYANKIKQLFVPTTSSNKFVWKKGKILVSYNDWNKGYALQLLVPNETEGKRIIKQVLSIKNDTPDWENMNVIENEEPLQRYPTNPGTITILGRRESKPVVRPVVNVTFQYAYALLWAKAKPIILVDTIGKYRNAIISM